MTSPDLQQTLFDIYLEEILIPALVELPEVDFKKTSRQVKEGAARYLRYRRGASINTIARHLGVSARWVSMVTNGPPPEEPEEGWFMAIMDVMTDEFPDTVSARRVQSRLRRRNRQLSFQATKAHLDLYCDLGKLERVGEGYRAFAPVEIAVDSGGVLRSEKLKLKLQALRPICESYGRGDKGAIFGHLVGEVDERCLEDMSQELQQAFGTILEKYKAQSLQMEASSQANLVSISGLLALGRGGPISYQGDPECLAPLTTASARTSSSSGSSGFSGPEDEP